jgi:hypothetical protein
MNCISKNELLQQELASVATIELDLKRVKAINAPTR